MVYTKKDTERLLYDYVPEAPLQIFCLLDLFVHYTSYKCIISEAYSLQKHNINGLNNLSHHCEMKEQKSWENRWEGARGGGFSTMASTSSYTLVHPFMCSGGVYGNLPVAHSSRTSPKLHISLLLPYAFPMILSGWKTDDNNR